MMRYALVTLLLAAAVCAVSGRAEGATGDVDAKFRTLRVALSYGDTGAKLGAIGAVAKLGRNGEGAAGLLVNALSDSDRSVRLAAIGALGKIGPSTQGVVAAMTKLVGGKDGAMAEAAVKVLGQIGPGAAPAVDALLKYAEGKDSRVRMLVIYALGMIGPAADRAVPMLIQTLKKSSDYNLRENAAYALGNIGQPIETVVPALIGALADDHCNVRARGARALGMIGPPAAKAQAALRKTLKDTNPAVVLHATRALGRLEAGDEQTIAALIKLLSSSTDYPLAAAALGKAGKPGIDALVKMLGSQDAVRRLLAVRALGQIGLPAEAAAPAMKKATADKDANVRRAAALALKKIVIAPAQRVNVLAIDGKHTLVCNSSWHNINKSWELEGKVNISGIEVLAMIKPKPAEGQYTLPRELAASLSERLFKAAQFTPAQEQELARWLGSGKCDEKSSSEGAMTATSKTHIASDGTTQVEVSLNVPNSSAKSTKASPVSYVARMADNLKLGDTVKIGYSSLAGQTWMTSLSKSGSSSKSKSSSARADQTASEAFVFVGSRKVRTSAGMRVAVMARKGSIMWTFQTPPEPADTKPKSQSYSESSETADSAASNKPAPLGEQVAAFKAGDIVALGYKTVNYQFVLESISAYQMSAAGRLVRLGKQSVRGVKYDAVFVKTSKLSLSLIVPTTTSTGGKTDATALASALKALKEGQQVEVTYHKQGGVMWLDEIAPAADITAKSTR